MRIAPERCSMTCVIAWSTAKFTIQNAVSTPGTASMGRSSAIARLPAAPMRPPIPQMIARRRQTPRKVALPFHARSRLSSRLGRSGEGDVVGERALCAGARQGPQGEGEADDRVAHQQRPGGAAECGGDRAERDHPQDDQAESIRAAAAREPREHPYGRRDAAQQERRYGLYAGRPQEVVAGHRGDDIDGEHEEAAEQVPAQSRREPSCPRRFGHRAQGRVPRRWGSFPKMSAPAPSRTEISPWSSSA